MFQETQHTQAQNHKNVYEINSQHSQSVVRIMRVFGGVIRKVAATALFEFHTFVENGAPQGHPQNEYWWDSPDSVDKIFKP